MSKAPYSFRANHPGHLYHSSLLAVEFKALSYKHYLSYDNEQSDFFVGYIILRVFNKKQGLPGDRSERVNDFAKMVATSWRSLEF